MSTMEKCCRMCHQNSGVLVSPCGCEGSMKYVHSKCLSDWVSFRRSLSCEVCGVSYSVTKVLGIRQPHETHKKVILLLSICVRRYTRKGLDVVLPFLFRLLALISVPLIFAFFYSIQVLVISRILSWHSLTPSLVYIGGLSPGFSFTMGLGFTLVTVPFFFLWRAWGEWCASHEEVFPTGVMREGEAEGIIADPAVSDYSGEVDAEHYDWSETHLFEPAVLPDDSAVILETIDLTKKRLNDGGALERLMSSQPLPLILQFLSFSIFVCLLIGPIPELVHLTVVRLWRMVDGSSHFSFFAEWIFMTFSTSANVTQVRYNMFLLLMGALGSSRIVVWSLAYLSRIVTISTFLLVANRLNRLPYRKTVVSLLIFLRSIFNILMLLFCTVPTLCLLARVFCVDLFTSDASIETGDYDKALEFLSLSGNNQPENVYSHEKPEVSLFHSPIVIFRALEVLLQNRRDEDGICWNFMKLYIPIGGNNNFGHSGENIMMDVYGDDSVLFSLFASTVFVSNVDVWSLVESSYLVALFMFMSLCHICFVVGATPSGWLGWSCLWNVCRTNLFKVMSILDVKMFVYLYCEICALSVFVLCVFIRSSLDVVNAICSTAILQLPVVENISTTVGWLRIIFISQAVPQRAIWLAHKQVIFVLSGLFQLEDVMNIGPLSLLCLLSRVIRVIAFILCYWAFSIGMLTACLIPGLYLLYEQVGFLRSALFIFFNVYQYIDLLHLNAQMVAQWVMRYLFTEVKSVIVRLRDQWWLCSSFGLLVRQQNRSEEGIPMYDVKHIFAIPSSLRSLHASKIQSAFLLLNSKEENSDSLPSLQRTKNALKLFLSDNEASCKLYEGDISLLISLIQPPSLKSVMRYLLFCTLYIIVLPSIAGLTVMFWIQSIVLGPHCYSGPQMFFFEWSWATGVLILFFLSVLNRNDRNAVIFRFSSYCFSGLHYYTTKDAITFVLIPLFLKLASITIVPYTLKNGVVLFLSGSNVAFGEHIFFFFMLTLLAASICRHVSATMGVGHQVWRPRFNFLGRKLPGQVGARRVVHSEETYPVAQSDETREGIFQSEVRVEDERRNTIVVKINTIKHSCGEAIVRLKLLFLAMKESILLFLTDVAKRESIVDVLFVDRGETNARTFRS